MVRLDVHVLMHKSIPQVFVDEMQRSVSEAVSKAGFPVDVFYLEGVDGHIGLGRKKGYAMGDAPYKLAIDADDYTSEDAFAQLRPLLENGAKAVSMGEYWVADDKVVAEKPAFKHHFVAYRADLLTDVPFENLAFFPDQYLLSNIETVHIAKAVYYYRIRLDSASRIIRKSKRAEFHAEQMKYNVMRTFLEQGQTYGQLREITESLK